MYPSACTMQERCADQPLELADAHRERRLGDVRLRRSLGEAAGVHDSQKIAKEVAVDHRHHLCPVAKSFNFCRRSEEHTSELQSLMRTSYAVFCLKKKKILKTLKKHTS